MRRTLERARGLADRSRRPGGADDQLLRQQLVELRHAGIRRDATSVEARGSLALRQTDFGITPFSVAGGAIQVADVLEVSFVITAVRR